MLPSTAIQAVARASSVIAILSHLVAQIAPPLSRCCLIYDETTAALVDEVLRQWRCPNVAWRLLRLSSSASGRWFIDWPDLIPSSDELIIHVSNANAQDLSGEILSLSFHMTRTIKAPNLLGVIVIISNADALEQESPIEWASFPAFEYTLLALLPTDNNTPSSPMMVWHSERPLNTTYIQPIAAAEFLSQPPSAFLTDAETTALAPDIEILEFIMTVLLPDEFIVLTMSTVGDDTSEEFFVCGYLLTLVQLVANRLNAPEPNTVFGWGDIQGQRKVAIRMQSKPNKWLFRQISPKEINGW